MIVTMKVLLYISKERVRGLSSEIQIISISFHFSRLNDLLKFCRNLRLIPTKELKEAKTFQKANMSKKSGN